METKTCEECESLYYKATSQMASICPACAHSLYDYENCKHVFEKGRCIHCYWDGSTSDFIHKQMEPQILMLGRKLEVMEILASELEKFDRKVFYANDESLIEKHLNTHAIDFVVMGAGLPDERREELKTFIQKQKPELPVHLIVRSKAGGPTQMITFTHEKAIEWKIKQVLRH